MQPLRCQAHVRLVGVRHPLGKRGEYPIFYAANNYHSHTLEQNLPGVIAIRGGVKCTLDASPIVAAFLGETEIDIDGMSPDLADLDINAYNSYFKNVLRPYQKRAVEWLLRRPYGWLQHPMQSGKSATALAASVTARSAKTLIMCPSISKPVWADEVRKWLNEPAIILDGWSNNRMRKWCLTCGGMGRVYSERCPDCKQRNGSTYGYNLIEINQTEEPVKRDEDRRWTCRKHTEFRVEPGEVVDCPICSEEFHTEADAAKWIIVAYDLLVSAAQKDARGRIMFTPGMTGWRDWLMQWNFDVAIMDEIHLLRGYDPKKKGNRRDAAKMILAQIPTVWGLTGTPIFTHVKDLWSQYDLMSNGLWGRTPTKFHTRYCDGHEESFGQVNAQGKPIMAWIATGSSNEDELKVRLERVRELKTREQIAHELPITDRQVYRIDAGDHLPKSLQAKNKRGSILQLVEKLAKVKKPYVVEKVMPQLAEGAKVLVLVYNRSASEDLAKALNKELGSKEWRGRMSNQNAKVLAMQTKAGLSDQMRFALAKEFREREGATVAVATYDSLPASLSLFGATYIHAVDFHVSPSAMEQAMARPCRIGARGIHVLHYVVQNSIDEILEQDVIPLFQLKDKMGETEAGATANAFKQPDKMLEELSIEDIFERMTAHILE